MFGFTELKIRQIEGPVDPNYTETWEARWLADLKDSFTSHGKVPPTLAFLADDPEDPSAIVDGLMDLSQFLVNDETKNVMEQILPTLLKEISAFALIQICEAWTIPGEKIDEYHAGNYDSMEEFPGSNEVVLFSVQTHGGAKITCFEIDRSGDKPTLKDTPVPKEFAQMQGRMANWLARKKDKDMN